MPKKSRRAGEPKRDRKTFTLIALFVVAAALVGGGLLWQNNRVAEAANSYTSKYTPEEVVTAGPVVQKYQVSEVMRRLNDQARPFQIAVVGDSTGVARQGWVYQMAEALGKATGRTVNFRQWAAELDPPRYYKPQTVHQGGAATIEIWNGSASGKGLQYSSDLLEELLPLPAEQPDLIFLNHGHNARIYELELAAKNLLIRMTEEHPDTAVVAILQNPQDPNVAGAAKHTTNINLLRDFLQVTNFPFIDVYSAYIQQPGWETWFIDNHPDPRGNTLWADLVLKYIGFPR